jgi:N-methylhydantoinase A/oxoprolinase/acetone carboxylase beta subunit
VNTRVGVDTGGTFTDVVTASGEAVKLLSTPGNPAQAVATGVARGGGAATLAHGTTVATNALLERLGGRVALLTSEGQRDVIEIARQTRPSLYDVWADRPEPLVPRNLRFEVSGRVDALGNIVTPLGSPPRLPAGLDAVAVCLLHSDINQEHERTLARDLAEAATVVCSSTVSPEYREYERTVTTVADAYLRRPCQAYLQALSATAPEVLVLTSAGGLIPLAEASARPVALLVSGPAGGVSAGAAAGLAAGFGDCVTLDMGGTSTDVCLVRGGRPEPAAERQVAGLPIRMPSLDVHTIGAGGGSIARIDAGGALLVGPQSAGAVPGPVCYGLGGAQVTVTDADLVAGRIPVDGLEGLGRLNVDAARVALGRLGISAEGVIAVVDEAMTEALRAVSVRRGVDPSGLALIAFGGAGPLHACALADALGMPAVVVPVRAGVLSAVGILGAPRQADLVRSCPDRLDYREAERSVEALAAEACRAVGETVDQPCVMVGYDCRYAGQSHELTVPSIRSFHREHGRRNGYVLEGSPVEVVAVRVSARISSPVDIAGLPSPDRRGPVRGPAALAEPDCSIWVAPGWVARVHPSGAWVLTREG